MEKLYISKKYLSSIGNINIISSDKGIKEVLINKPSDDFYMQGDPFDALNQIKSYFKKSLTTFDLPFDIIASEFTKKVLLETAKIQFGQTSSYGEIAKKIGSPSAFRAVGGALNKNPLPIIIPCHRVLSKSSLGGFALGTNVKILLLSHEGIIF